MREGIEDHRDEVIFPNPEIFREKLSKLVQGGARRLQIVADFDRTLTAFRTGADDKRINTTPALLWQTMPQEYIKRAAELFAKYRPIEIDPAISIEEKLVHMERWTRAWQRNCVELGLKRSMIEEIARPGLLVPRPRLSNFMRTASEQDIPVLIFSAGVGNVIVEYLRNLDIYTSNVHVISNFANFDESGACTGWSEDVVTSVTKNESHALHQEWSRRIQRRSNVLLLGDHPADIHMADGAKHDTVLSVGYLNGDHEHLEAHTSTFDAVIAEDVGLDFPLNVLSHI